ncbi:phosphopantetheine-binding protein [Corynebacterium sp.]|uniref:phosphopantetheine-binding protein n=1 Tax=Corynebacterium sp. TaxID=1720 RepID=UPI0026474F1A|nr:phosphopantetheine-binding protein [Corynebacterium sp.]MDN5721497.1 phosphopantetheine-binding protein [Corynebacterium sp.]MDN6281629.1 phosphopantetheine-binding protein [Corynebacterium sp.]MDN6351883.1 phosphopantetheine-binding protein [Corynebacterium sp.]MDN6367342.1 phosphopantetheine-binding protein [Corynebacterium sp.]MDN6374870.1 phosphopantetheine-binding protein [Corynebacterium sp.]
MTAQRDRVAEFVCEILYIDDEDLIDGDDTDLREFGLDSVRFMMLLDALELTGEEGVVQRIFAVPTIRTLVEETCRR